MARRRVDATARSLTVAAALLAASAVSAACGVSDAPGSAGRGGAAVSAAGAAGASPGAASADTGAHPGAAGDHEAEVAELRAFEDRRRRATDFATLPAGDRQLGANPYQLRRLAGDRAVGALRGADAVVLVDERGRERARAPAPPTPTALVVDRAGRIWVGGTGSREIALYRARGDRLQREARLALEGAWTVRALAASPDGSWLYAADQRTGLVAALAIESRGASARIREQRVVGRCREPIQLALAGPWLVVNCLAEHALVASPLDPRGRPTGADPVRVVHDGPFWSLAAASDGGRAIVAAGGVEDHPLVREAGGFGYIDSFLYLYELPAAGAARRLAAVNLSEQGVVTPKWVALELDAGAAVVRTAGYATDVHATLTWPALEEAGRPLPAPAIERRRFLPGSTDWSPGEAGAPDLAASPLFDGWIVFDGAPALQPAGDSPPRSTESRVGEALFFTTLMSPWNRSDGNLSRFTCETCHFEAYGDGRVHFTGRGTVHASTKPLRGLFNNRPHFTRALDRSMAQMVHAEFRVANRWNGRDPWFALAAGDVPWLASIEGAPPSMSALYLRRALMSFLMELTFEPNQVVRGRRRFSARERAGAELFRRRCESCHGARLVAEEPSTAVPFESWEPLVFSPQGPIVWASAGYRKTGVEPYPHPQGARTTSLRRVHHKFPHFTSGSARSLADVVERAAWVGDRFLHEGAPDDAERLQPDQRASLLAFLELL